MVCSSNTTKCNKYITTDTVYQCSHCLAIARRGSNELQRVLNSDPDPTMPLATIPGPQFQEFMSNAVILHTVDLIKKLAYKTTLVAQFFV